MLINLQHQVLTCVEIIYLTLNFKDNIYDEKDFVDYSNQQNSVFI
jgi:hypothetical protein